MATKAKIPVTMAAPIKSPKLLEPRLVPPVVGCWTGLGDGLEPKFLVVEVVAGLTTGVGEGVRLELVATWALELALVIITVATVIAGVGEGWVAPPLF